MKNVNVSKQLFGLLLAGACGINWAQATPVVDYKMSDGGLEYIGLCYDGTTRYVTAGGIQLSQPYLATDPNFNPSMAASFSTLALDVGAGLIVGDTYHFGAPTVFQGQTGTRPNWGAGNASSVLNPNNARAAIQAAADLFYKNSGLLTSGSATDKAALQLAVWEALYDTDVTKPGLGLGLAGGRFLINSTTDKYGINDTAALAEAAAMLSTINPGVAAIDLYSGYLLQPDPQIQNGGIAQEVFYGVNPVPEPTTFLCGALLVAPVAASIIRSRRQKRQAAPAAGQA